MKNQLLKTMLLLFALIAGGSNVWAAVSVPTPEAGTFVIDFYDSEKLTSTSGSGLTSNNYLNFVGVPTGVTKADVVSGVTTDGTVQYGKNGGLTIGTGSANSNSVTFTIGSSYVVNKCTVYATAYEAGRWLINGDAASSGSIGEKGAELSTITSPLVWIFATGQTSLAFTKDNGSGANQKRLTIYRIVCEYSVATTPTCVTPTISPTSGSVLSGTEVTLTTTTEGATIHYTMGENPADPTTSSATYTTPIQITAATTIKAIAVKNGYNNSSVATASYTIATPFTNFAALTAETTAGTKYVTLSNATVTYVNGNYAYIQDASGAVVLYKSSHGLTAGDVLNGTATVAYQLKNQNPQITDISGVTKTSGDAPNPTEVAQSACNYTFNNVLSQYFKITGASIFQSNDKYYVSLGDDDVQLYKVGGSLSISDLAKKFTIIGFPTLYNTTKELQIFTAPAEEVSSDPIIAANPTVLNDFVYEVGAGPSEAKTISVSGSSLTGNITISMASGSNYEMSLSENDGYTNYLSLTPTTGTVAATTIYVRMKSGLTIGNYPGSITVASAGVTDNIVIGLSGNVTPHYTSGQAIMQ